MGVFTVRGEKYSPMRLEPMRVQLLEVLSYLPESSCVFVRTLPQVANMWTKYEAEGIVTLWEEFVWGVGE